MSDVIIDDGIRYKLIINPDNTILLAVLGISEDNKKTDIIIKETVTRNNIDYSVLSIENEAFIETMIESIYIPKSITKIGDRAFSSVKSLETCKFEDDSNLEIIGNSAFNGTSIEIFTIPKKVIRIEGGAFNYMDKLKQVIFKGDKPEIEPYAFSQNIGLFTNPPFGYVDNKTYPRWKNVNTIDDLMINRLLVVVKIIPVLLVLLFISNMYIFINSPYHILNIIIWIILVSIIILGVALKQFYFFILLYFVPYLLSIYNMFNTKFKLGIRLPIALLLLVLYKYKFSQMLG